MSADNAFDVWIVDRNTVYQRVPYNVVADWVEEGRLLDKDCVRPAGQTSAAWQRIKEHPQLAPFLAILDIPREEEPPGGEDQELDLVIEEQKKEVEDDDVDMIPLIDISMVLLVFFMMTAENLVAGLPVNSPESRYAKAISDVSKIPVSVLMDEGGQVYFIVGEGESEDNRVKSEEAAAQKVKAEMNKPNAFEVYKIVIRADSRVPYERVQLLTEKLELIKGVMGIQAQVRQKGGGD